MADPITASIEVDAELERVFDFFTQPDHEGVVRGGGGGVRRLDESVRLPSALGAGDEAMLLYDIDVGGLGTMRVVEHFTVAQGVIVRLRQIHDTHALRAAGAAAA